jgi:hypothetical protein
MGPAEMNIITPLTQQITRLEVPWKNIAVLLPNWFSSFP